jgi:hypothetical protein
VDLRLRYGLAGGAPGAQAAAMVYDTPQGLSAYDRLTFAVRAEHPMRVSVQLRGGAGAAVEKRWQRSVYLDPALQERTVFFDDMNPVGAANTPTPDLANIRSILFVIDANNAKPGDSGRVWIRRASLER